MFSHMHYTCIITVRIDELPHLTAYWRRLRRLSARPTLLISGGWLALVLVAMMFPQLLSTNAGALTSLGIVITGKFAIYWVLAETMGSLAREGKRASPAWYMTPLSNHAALLGTLLTALAAILPPLAGLMAYLPLHAGAWLSIYLFDPSGLAQFGCSAMTIFETTGQFISRLALFALFAACMQLGLRRMAYAPALPVLLAAAATLLGFWQASNFEPLPVTAGFLALSWVWTSAILALSVLGCVVLLFICKWCAEMESPGALYGIPLLTAIALPTVLSLSAIGWLIESVLSNYSYRQNLLTGWVYSPVLQPVHALYALFSPDASPIVKYEGWKSMFRISDDGVRLHYYSTSLSGNDVTYGWLVFFALAALSFGLLWFTCMHCLEVARNPAKRLAPEKRRNRK